MRLLRTGVVLVAAAFAATLAAAPAQAVDGKVYARVFTGAESGGSASSYLNFTGKRSMVFGDFHVNDICPGDGKPVSGQAVVRFMDGTKWTGPRHWDDTTCDSGYGVDFGNLPFNSSKRIKAAWVRVCAGDRCSASNHRDNGHTG